MTHNNHFTIRVDGQSYVITPIAGKVFEHKPVEFVSYEGLIESGDDYEDTSKSVEDIGILIAMSSKLHQALNMLSEEERELIDALFFSNCGEGMSERSYGKSIGITHKTVAYRKKAILGKLKKLMES